jgi:hypothetical protein
LRGVAISGLAKNACASAAVCRYLLLLLTAVAMVSCKKSSPQPVSADLPNWERSHYQAGKATALIYFVVYGQFSNDVKISRSKYRTAGLPEDFTLTQVSRKKHGPLPFTDGEFGKSVKDAALFERTQQASEGMILRGEIADPPNLNYLRDSIGVLTFFMDHGGFAVCDPQQFELYDAERWRRDIFDPGATNLFRHVKILFFEEPGGAWYHTRGMRKFARPDLSVRKVPREYSEAAIDLCNRFILMQALGAQIPEGQEIRVKSLPPGLICHHLGSLDDPDFNNVHVEINWPTAK